MMDPTEAILASQHAIHAWQAYCLDKYWDGPALNKLACAMDGLRIALGLPDVVSSEIHSDYVN